MINDLVLEVLFLFLKQFTSTIRNKFIGITCDVSRVVQYAYSSSSYAK